MSGQGAPLEARLAVARVLLEILLEHEREGTLTPPMARVLADWRERQDTA